LCPSPASCLWVGCVCAHSSPVTIFSAIEACPQFSRPRSAKYANIVYACSVGRTAVLTRFFSAAFVGGRVGLVALSYFAFMVHSRPRPASCLWVGFVHALRCPVAIFSALVARTFPLPRSTIYAHTCCTCSVGYAAALTRFSSAARDDRSLTPLQGRAAVILACFFCFFARFECPQS
jgi:hypothetical protein